MKTTLLFTFLLFGSLSYAGGDWRPRTPPSGNNNGQCTATDGSRLPCPGGAVSPRAKSSPFACINGMANPQTVVCTRTPTLAAASTENVGTSTLHIEVSQWVQNPNTKDVCPIIGQSGYGVNLQIYEVNSVEDAGAIGAVIGKTREGNVVFKDYFVDHVQFTGNLSRAVAIDTGKNTAGNGLDAGSFFTFQNGKLELTGTVHSFTMGVTGKLNQLEFECK